MTDRHAGKENHQSSLEPGHRVCAEYGQEVPMRELSICELEVVSGGIVKALLRAGAVEAAKQAAGAIKNMIDNAEEGQVDMGNPNNLANVYGA